MAIDYDKSIDPLDNYFSISFQSNPFAYSFWERLKIAFCFLFPRSKSISWADTMISNEEIDKIENCIKDYKSH